MLRTGAFTSFVIVEVVWLCEFLIVRSVVAASPLPSYPLGPVAFNWSGFGF